MIHADLSLNVPIMCYDMPLTGGPEMTLFEYHKVKFRKNIIWYKTPRTGQLPLPNYPINMIDGRGQPRSQAVRILRSGNPLLDNPATNILAETSDKFVAILNIVKQQDARIEEFERMFLVMSTTIEKMSTTIEKLERIICDKDDSVVEAMVNEEPPVEETNDELTSESDSEWGLIVNTQ